jgi:hypothetical protein
MSQDRGQVCASGVERKRRTGRGSLEQPGGRAVDDSQKRRLGRVGRAVCGPRAARAVRDGTGAMLLANLWSPALPRAWRAISTGPPSLTTVTTNSSPHQRTQTRSSMCLCGTEYRTASTPGPSQPGAAQQREPSPPIVDPTPHANCNHNPLRHPRPKHLRWPERHVCFAAATARRVVRSEPSKPIATSLSCATSARINPYDGPPTPRSCPVTDGHRPPGPLLRASRHHATPT